MAGNHFFAKYQDLKDIEVEILDDLDLDNVFNDDLRNEVLNIPEIADEVFRQDETAVKDQGKVLVCMKCSKHYKKRHCYEKHLVYCNSSKSLFSIYLQPNLNKVYLNLHNNYLKYICFT